MRYLSHNIYHVDYELISSCSRVVFASLAVATFGFVTLYVFLFWSFLAVL